MKSSVVIKRHFHSIKLSPHIPISHGWFSTIHPATHKKSLHNKIFFLENMLMLAHTNLSEIQNSGLHWKTRYKDENAKTLAEIINKKLLIVFIWKANGSTYKNMCLRYTEIATWWTRNSRSEITKKWRKWFGDSRICEGATHSLFYYVDLVVSCFDHNTHRINLDLFKPPNLKSEQLPTNK